MNIKKTILTAGLGFMSFTWVPTTAFAAPQKAASTKTTLPVEVRALTPKSATTFFCERLNIGFKASKMLVHVWGDMRPRTGDDFSGNSYDSYYDSPICVDVFAPHLSSKQKWGWKLVSSASFMESAEPSVVVSHWLQPNKKQGCVLEIIASHGAPGASTAHTILTWPQGFEETYETPLPFTLFTGGISGGNISLNWKNLDAKGFTTITSIDSFGGKVNSSTPYHWDGVNFVSR